MLKAGHGLNTFGYCLVVELGCRLDMGCRDGVLDAIWTWALEMRYRLLQLIFMPRQYAIYTAHLKTVSHLSYRLNIYFISEWQG